MDSEKFRKLLLQYDSNRNNQIGEKAKKQLMKHPKLLERVAEFGLGGIMKNPPHFNSKFLRKSAISLISNEEILGKIACRPIYGDFRLEAIKNPHLKDEKILYNVVFGNPSKYYNTSCYVAATRKINNQKMLIDIAYSNKPSIVRMSAIAKIENDEVLKKIALNEFEVIDVRKAALDHIQDDRFLFNLASFDSSLIIREVAVRNLKDQSLLETIVKSENLDESLVLTAVKNVTNTKVLMDLAESSNPKISLAAIQNPNLKDRMDVIKKIARNKLSDVSLRLTAINNIFDEDLLIYLSKNPNPRIRLAAVKNPYLINEEVLMDIVKYDENSRVRDEAIKKINNKEFLAEVLLHQSHYRFNTTVLNIDVLPKINSKNLLSEIMKNPYSLGGKRLNEINSLSRYRQFKLLEEDQK